MERTFGKRPTTFRINTIKADPREVLSILSREGFKVRRIDWYSDAFVLMSRSQRELEKLSIYQEGQIYLQSLASMVPVIALDPQPNDVVLDMTAAPGSKTSQIAAQMKMKGELIGYELSPIRFERLSFNLKRLGVLDSDTFAKIEKRDATSLLRDAEMKERFDKILLDAPCSGEARIVEGDPRTIKFWSEKFIQANAADQAKLLQAAWYALKPGGVLLYSTCTFAPEENEEQVSRLVLSVSDAVIEPLKLKPTIKTVPALRQWRSGTLCGDIVNCRRHCSE